MAWRTAIVSEAAKLSSHNEQLVVSQNGEDVTIPLEDLAFILLESPQISLSVPLLERASFYGVPIAVCDKQHTPSGLFLPCFHHCRMVELVHKQVELSKSFRAKCWEQVVRQKIINQAHCLEFNDKANGKKLRAIAKDVERGDKSNKEAYASQVYFKSLFSNSFRRWDEGEINKALNYGYAIVRAGIARAIVARGLSPLFGIHHHAKLNPFNLADDFVEPFRPLIDCRVYELFTHHEGSFDKNLRVELVDTLNQQILSGDEFRTVLRAMEIFISSFVDVIETKDVSRFIQPVFYERSK